MNINRDYLIINDVKKSNVKLDNGSMFFYITDKNTQNIFVNLVINVSNNDLIQKYANIENAEDYTLTMNIVKPDNTHKIIEGKLHDKEKAIFEFNLSEDCCDEIGPYRCELLTKCNINGHEEITTSNKLTYKVKSSVLNDLDDIVEAPEYPLVIQLFDKLSDIEQYEEDRRANELARQLAEEQRQTRFNTLDADMVGRVNAMDSKMDDVEARISAKEQAVDKLIVDTKVDIDDYKVAKDTEIDEYKTAKDQQIDQAMTNQNNKIDEAIANQNDRIVVVENNVVAQNSKLDVLETKATTHEARITAVEAKDTEQDSRLDVAENRLANIGNDITNTMQPIIDGHTSRLDAIEAVNVAQNSRLDAIEVKNQQQDDRLLDIEKVNSKQDIDIKCLYGASQTIDVTKEGNSIYLQNSNNGFTIIDNIQGNTMVNCNKEPDKEIILNGNINTQGHSNVTLTEGVDGGLVDVALEGNTMVNVCDQKDSVALPFNKDLTYLYVDTQYAVQFVSNAVSKVNITLGGAELLNQNVVIGTNKYTITTPSELVDNNLVLNGEGFNASNIVVTEATGQEFGYFEGMKSVGECEELEVISRNVNILDINKLADANNWLKDIYWSYPIEVKPNTNYTMAVTCNRSEHILFGIFGKPGAWIDPISPFLWGGDVVKGESYTCNFNTGNRNIIYINMYMSSIDAFSTEGILRNPYLSETSLYNGYAPHQSNTQILTHEPLRAVGDVKDKYVLIDGKWYIERKCDTRAYQEGDIDNYITDKINTVYPLSSPTYELINYNPFTVYSDTTHISNNSTIPCNMTIKNTGYNCLLKPSTTYTVSSNLGLNLVTTPNTLTEDCLRFYDTDTSTVTTMKNVTILEGDYTTGKPLPSHFSGIESAFEQQYDEAVGKYKVKIRVVGKNFINLNEILSGSTTGYNTSLLNIPLSLKKGTYTISFSNIEEPSSSANVIKVCDYNNPSDTICTVLRSSKKATFILAQDTDVDIIYIPTGSYTLTGLQLEQGTKATPYEPYKENYIEFYINEPLRGIRDVKDKVYVKNDKVVVERNCGSEVFDGSDDEGWTLIKTNTNTIAFGYKKLGIKNISTLISNIFINANIYSGDLECVWCNDMQNIQIQINQSKLSTQDVVGFKQWLQQNPLIVVYQLAEPVYEEVEYNDVKLIIESFKNSTLFYDSNIPVTSKLWYSYSVPIVDTVAQTANVTDQQDQLIINLATQVAVLEMMTM